MKKAILTFGLFSLVVLTSFTTTETKTQNIVAETGDTGGSSNTTSGGQSIGNKKLQDYTVSNAVTKENKLETYSNTDNTLEFKKKLDILYINK
ncbi:hypothetical protein [Flavobacterium lindanitolerans]|uniref:hypothetical protein n=1 Tax=Flavobacterium lindanitolerans TaxID=428988 RepID=UPI0027BA1B16|nr:hypothetical protein [Flavobacterium lindanitolerans]